MVTKGRPRLSIENRRIPTSTTLPFSVVEFIRMKDWRMNELVIDGIKHRGVCSDFQEKIAKLQAIIEEQAAAIEALKALSDLPSLSPGSG
jgi:hypothetical protein